LIRLEVSKIKIKQPYYKNKLYFNIMRSINSGCNTGSKIAIYLHKKQSSIARQLQELQFDGLIKVHNINKKIHNGKCFVVVDKGREISNLFILYNNYQSKEKILISKYNELMKK